MGPGAAPLPRPKREVFSMAQIVYDVIVWINVISFAVAFIDKIACGALSGLFWLSTMCFGAGGSAAGCLMFHHRTRNGDFGAVVFFGLIQFGILYLLERIF